MSIRIYVRGANYHKIGSDYEVEIYDGFETIKMVLNEAEVAFFDEEAIEAVKELVPQLQAKLEAVEQRTLRMEAVLNRQPDVLVRDSEVRCRHCGALGHDDPAVRPSGFCVVASLFDGGERE